MCVLAGRRQLLTCLPPHTTGALEFYSEECLALIQGDEPTISYYLMAPNFACMGYVPRMLTALAMEHIFIAVVLFIMHDVNNIPKSVRLRVLRKEVEFKRRLLADLDLHFGAPSSSAHHHASRTSLDGGAAARQRTPQRRNGGS